MSPIVECFPVVVPASFLPSDVDGDGVDLRGDGRPCPGYGEDKRPKWGGGFDSPRGPQRHWHRAIDIMAAEGALIVSPCDGVVPETVRMSLDGRRGPHPGSGQGEKAGNYVCIVDENGWRWYFSHMRDPALVQPGEQVTAGQVVGYVGRTGNASYNTRTGKRGCPHLHAALTRPAGMTSRQLNRLRGPDGQPVRWKGDKVDPVPFLRPFYP